MSMLDIVKEIDEDKSSQLGQGREEVMGRGMSKFLLKEKREVKDLY